MSDYEDNQFQDDDDEQEFDPENPDQQLDEEEPEGEDLENQNYEQQGGDQDEDEDEEDDQGPNEYEKDDFIVDEDNEDDNLVGDDEGLDDIEERRRKKHKKRKRDLQLDEDDFDLLQEHGTRVPRHLLEKKKRIKKKGHEGEKRSDIQQLHQTLFGTNDFDDLDEDEDQRLEGRDLDDNEMAPNYNNQNRYNQRDDVDDIEDDEFDEEEDEMADFIADDDDELNQQQNLEGGDMPQQPFQRKQKKKKKLFGGLRNVPYQAMKEAAAICGDVDSVLEQYYSRKQAQNFDQDLGDDEQVSEELLEQQALGNITREQLMQINKIKKIDPTVIQRQYLTPEDMLIRIMDIPERHLLRYKPLISFNEQSIEDLFRNFDVSGCAQWIYDTLYAEQAYIRTEKELLEEGLLEVQGTPNDGREYWDLDELEGISKDADKIQTSFRMVRKKRNFNRKMQWRSNETAQDNVKEAIENVLTYMYVKNYEVPMIACYYKDICGELLSMFEDDKPQVTTQKELKEIKQQNEQTPIELGAVLAHHRRVKRWNILWSIWEYSIKYWQLSQRKQRIRQKLDKLYSQVQDEEDKLTIFNYISKLDDLKNTLDLDVLAHKVRILTSSQNIEQQLGALNLNENGASNGIKRPQGQTQKEFFRLQLLQQIYRSQLLLSSEKFHDNVRYAFVKNDLTDPSGQTTLDDMLTEYLRVDLGWGDVEQLKRGIKEMAAQDLMTDVLIRDEVRKFFMEKGQLDTDLVNQEDDRLIDAFNPMCIVKRIRNKSLRSFQGSDLIIKVLKAQQQRLIKIDIHVNSNDQEDLLRKYTELYLSTGASAKSAEANDYRREIIREAVIKKIMPMAQQEVMGILQGLAKEHILTEMGNNLWNYVSRLPFRIESRFEDEGYINQLRLLVCSWSDGNPPTTFVMLDPQGQPIDFLRCQNLSGNFIKPQVFEYTQNREVQFSAGVIEDVERVKSFVMQHAPHAIMVAASGMESRNLKEGLEILKNFFLSEMPDFLRQKLHEVPNIYVGFENDKIAQIWSDSRQARDEFPEYDIILRKCIGLGRYLLEPLAIISGLCGPQRELGSLQLHPLQDSVTQDEKFRIIEQTLITGVCQAGVDINSMLQLPWMQTPLQFVGGLGPRKMDRFVQQLKSNQNRLQYRKDIFAYGYLTAVVATNCVGFMRVQQGQFTNNYVLDNIDFDALDDTRVHPLDYDLAKKIAFSALLNKKDDDEEEYDEDSAIQDAFAEHDLVQELDLGWYNKTLMESTESGKSVLAKLIDIQMEFIQPYGEMRADKQTTSEELFYLLSGESPAVLKPGRLVNCYVYRVDQQVAYVSVPDLKIEGTISIDDVSDRKVNVMNERLRPKMSFQARILSFDFEKFQVHLTCKSSALRDYDRWEEEYCLRVEKCYHIPTHLEREKYRQEIKRQHQQKRPQLKARPISHPMFKNVTINEAIAYLDKERDGSVIFRPHATSEMQLSFTLKLYKSRAYSNVYLNQNIDEVKKAQGPKAQLAIGRPLKVQVLGQEEKEEFDDLDEILARNIEPYMLKIKPIIMHPKYQDKIQKDLDEYLQNKFTASGGTTAQWCLGPFSTPGYFQIAYATKSESGNVRSIHQVFAPTPYGYYFRSQVFPKLDSLVAAFKTDPKGPQREQQQQQQYNTQANTVAEETFNDPYYNTSTATNGQYNNTYDNTNYNTAAYTQDYSQVDYSQPAYNQTDYNQLQYNQEEYNQDTEIPPPPPPPAPPGLPEPAQTEVQSQENDQANELDEW